MRRRRRNPEGLYMILGVLAGLAVLGAVVYGIRSKREAPVLVGATRPYAISAAPGSWYAWRGWPWMWLRPRALPAGTVTAY